MGEGNEPWGKGRLKGGFSPSNSVCLGVSFGMDCAMGFPLLFLFHRRWQFVGFIAFSLPSSLKKKKKGGGECC